MSASAWCWNRRISRNYLLAVSDVYLCGNGCGFYLEPAYKGWGLYLEPAQRNVRRAHGQGLLDLLIPVGF